MLLLSYCDTENKNMAADPADTVDPLDASQFNPSLSGDIEPEPWIAAAQLGLAIVLVLAVCWFVVFGIPWLRKKWGQRKP